MLLLLLGEGGIEMDLNLYTSAIRYFCKQSCIQRCIVYIYMYILELLKNLNIKKNPLKIFNELSKL